MMISVFIMHILEVLTLMYGCYLLRDLQRPFRILIYYIGFSVITGIISTLSANIYHNNFLVFQIYTPLEFVFVITIAVQLSKLKNSEILQIILVYLLIWILLFKWQGVQTKLDDISSSLASILIFFTCTIGLLKINITSEKSLFENSDMIVLLAFMIYFGGNLFVFLMTNIIFEMGNSHALMLWPIHNILHIILNIGFLYSFYLINKTLQIDD